MGLFDIFTSKNADEAAARRRAGYRQGFDHARGYIEEGIGRAEPYYDQAFNLFALPGERAGRGADLYADALGLNGPEGQSRARGTFQSSPGFAFQLDEANNLAERRAAARGSLAGGNVIDETTRLATGLAQQDYGNWLARLAPYNAQSEIDRRAAGRRSRRPRAALSAGLRQPGAARLPDADRHGRRRCRCDHGSQPGLGAGVEHARQSGEARHQLFRRMEIDDGIRHC